MSQPEERELAESYFSALPAGRLLDVPSGRLWLSRTLAARGFECHAADLYAEGEEIAGVERHRVDLNRALPFDDASFDYVACIEGVEHIESTHGLLREIGRVLRPGGRLLLSTPNVLSIKSRLRYLIRGRFYGFPHLYRDVAPGSHAHINPAPFPSLDLAARRAGLRLERVHPYPVRRKNWLYAPVAAILMVLTHLELAFSRKPPEYAELLRLLASPALLLGETLMVSYVRQAPCAD